MDAMELFNLYWYDIDGGQHLEQEHVPMWVIKAHLDRLRFGPGRVFIKEILVTDMLDCTVCQIKLHNPPQQPQATQ